MVQTYSSSHCVVFNQMNPSNLPHGALLPPLCGTSPVSYSHRPHLRPQQNTDSPGRAQPGNRRGLHLNRKDSTLRAAHTDFHARAGHPTPELRQAIQRQR